MSGARLLIFKCNFCFGAEAEVEQLSSIIKKAVTLPSGGSGADQVAFDFVREIQLVLNEKQYAALRSKLAKKIDLKGQLFSAHTQQRNRVRSSIYTRSRL